MSQSGSGAPRDGGAPESLDSILASLSAIAECFASDGGVILNAPPAGPDRDQAVAEIRWLVSRLPSLIAAQGQGVRDDGAPSVAALRIALADAQTAFSDEDDRHAALGWLLSHLSSSLEREIDGVRSELLAERRKAGNA